MPDYKPFLTDDHINFVRALGKGKENATTKAQIKELTGLSDRAQREIVEDLYHYHIPIAIGSNGKGYFIATSTAELAEYQRSECSRLKSLATKCYHIKQTFEHFCKGEDYAFDLLMKKCSQPTQ